MFSNVVSVVSLLVSAATATYAISVSRSVSHRQVTTELIAEYYSTMRALTEMQVQEWRLAHLFEVSDYAGVVAQLRSVAPPQPDSVARVELLIKERALALTIFGLYEHLVYQLDEAGRAGDKPRREFLTEATRYFTDRLLDNPRLRYLWSAHGGNLECEFEDSVRKHYAAGVPFSPGTWDADGPYG